MKKKVISYKLEVKSFLPLTILIILLTSCTEKPKTYNGYTKQDNFYYKLISIGDGKIKSDTSQTLWIDASCLTLKDSIFWDSKHNSSQKFFINVNTFPFLSHLYNFSVGDSLQYLFPSKTFFKDFSGHLGVAFFSENDSCVKFSVKILQVLNKNEVARIADSVAAVNLQQQSEEFSQIQNYVMQNFKKAIGISSQAFMEITHTTQLDSIKKGKRISMLYKGSYLDGRIVDSNPNNKPFEFIFGQEGQIIEGLRLALKHLKKGEKAKIILPSQLAFGNGGSSNGSITPYTPLLYEVEIVDVK